MASNTSIAIQPYLPQCTAQLVPTDFQSVDASTFKPGSLTYYTVCSNPVHVQNSWPHHTDQDMWQVWLPGAVLGGVAIFAATCFLVWLLLLCCRPHAYTYQLEWLANSPFYSSSRSVSMIGASNPAYTHRERKRRNNRGVQWLLLLATLAAVGLCSWGLAEAIIATDEQVPRFWTLVADAQQQARDWHHHDMPHKRCTVGVSAQHGLEHPRQPVKHPACFDHHRRPLCVLRATIPAPP